MRPLYLDFVQRRRHRTVLGPALLAGALLASVALGFWFAALSGAGEDAAQRESGLSRRGLAAQRPAAIALDADQDKRLAATLKQLTTPWEDLLASVEQASSEDVAVLALEQDAAQSSLKLLAEARNPAAMLDYLRRIEASKVLISATLETHKIDLQQAGQPVRFSIVAGYRQP